MSDGVLSSGMALFLLALRLDGDYGAAALARGLDAMVILAPTGSLRRCNSGGVGRPRVLAHSQLLASD